MGFLSAYSGTRRVPIGSEGSGYWVEIREVLSQGDKEQAERALTSGHVDGDRGVQIEMDTTTFRQEMVLASIIAWNLDEEDGTVWDVTMANVKRMPGIEFDRLFTIINDSNKPATGPEKRQFPDGGVGDHQDGNDGGRHTVIAGHVLARTGTVEAARPTT
jgi:hypothetical protein